MKTCNTCQTSKDESEFNRVRLTADGLCFCCRVCKELVGADGLTAFQRRCNPPPNIGVTNKPARRRGPRDHKIEKYGLTLEEYNLMLAEQGGVCAICQETNKICNQLRALCVDHDHETGKNRGLLCTTCNLAIGNLKDSARLVTAAAAYLTKHAEPSHCPQVDSAAYPPVV